MTHQTQIQAQTATAQASSKADMEDQTTNAKSYRIEASISNPDTFTGAERGNLYDARATIDRKKANDHARDFRQRGYWVMVFDNETHEHLAGPIDPDAALPSYIV